MQGTSQGGKVNSKKAVIFESLYILNMEREGDIDNLGKSR